MNMDTDYSKDTRQSKHNFFILEIGREKESYPHYFYNERSINYDDFELHINSCVKKSAEKIISLGGTFNKKISDFDLLFGSLEFLNAYGYKKFEPNFVFFENRDFDFSIESSFSVSKGEAALDYDFASKNEYRIFELAVGDGIYYDAIKRHLFLCPNSLSDVFNIANNKFRKIAQDLMEFTRTHSDLEADNSSVILNSIKGDFFDEICVELIESGIEEIHFHHSFCGCRHSFSPHFIALLGSENYENIIRHNNQYGINTGELPKNNSAQASSGNINDSTTPF
jgi:hypothetical protein